MNLVTVLGARPQFIKAAPVSLALKREGHDEILVHTGQHYDYEMSQVFFQELSLPDPAVNLGVGSGSHGYQTGQMLAGIEEVLLEKKPDRVLVYGDTNSTLAGALAAVKLDIPVAHVEAGLRSFNRKMPEEHNRVLTDHCADLLFCPTLTAVENLKREGLLGEQQTDVRVCLSGDTMYDAVLMFAELARRRSKILAELELKPKRYLLATLHRPYNTDDPIKLLNILNGLAAIGEQVVLPVHPRTRARILALGERPDWPGLKLVPPVGYLDMLLLEQNARRILTDSGGMQKEAYFFGVPCITLRPETEWVETVQSGWNILVEAQTDQILDAIRRGPPSGDQPMFFGDGRAANKIVTNL